MTHSSQKIEVLRDTLARYLPQAAVVPISDYIVRWGIRMVVSRERFSKLGDYRPPCVSRNYHSISVNGNLNAYLFLWVMLHEMAHLETYVKYKQTVLPHGHEWQDEYRTLIGQYAACFPVETAELVARYIGRLPLSSKLGRSIEEAFRRADGDVVGVPLDELTANSRFQICGRQGQVFETVEKRRTRWLCREVSSGAKFLVSGHAIVEPLEIGQ